MVSLFTVRNNCYVFVSIANQTHDESLSNKHVHILQQNRKQLHNLGLTQFGYVIQHLIKQKINDWIRFNPFIFWIKL